MWRCVILLTMMMTASAAAQDDPESAFRGRRIAEANCASCHAIAQYDDSPVRGAPPFRDLAKRFPFPTLSKLLSGPVFKVHAIMPDFTPNSEQAADLTNFILDLKSPSGG